MTDADRMNDAAMAAGIFDDVQTRHFDADSLRAQGYEVRRYGRTIVAATEGDLYEAITGRRSAVFDAVQTMRKAK